MKIICAAVMTMMIATMSYGQTKPKSAPGLKSPFNKKSPAPSRENNSARKVVSADFKPKVLREKSSVRIDFADKIIDKQVAQKSMNRWMNLNNDHTFKQISERSDASGFTHTNLQQFYKGFPVEGKTMMIHSKGSEVKFVNGHAEEELNLETNIKVSGERALQTAKAYMKASQLITEYPVETVVMNVRGTSAQLAHRVRIDSYSPLVMCYVYVDAKTGEVIKKRNLMAHTDAPGTAQTLYSGVQSITVDNQGTSFRLRETGRKIQTFDASTSTGLATGGFTASSDFTSATSSFSGVAQLTTFTVTSVTQAWWFTTFADETPDLYIVVKDAAQQIVYASAVVNDQNPTVTFSNINLVLSNPPYKVELWDDDGVDTDDLGGTYAISNVAGSTAWSGNGNAGTYNVTSTGLPALDVHWGMEKTYDFYKNVLGRNSYDGNGGLIKNYVNPPLTDNDVPGWPNNAFALSSPYNFMVYGNGDGAYMDPVMSLDVEGHEFTHLVVDYNGNGGLEYEGESGALNESFADIFGTSVEFYAKGANANWTIAEDIMVSGLPLRSMANPKSRNQPNTYGGTNWIDPSNTASDNGGVHRNSGVQNFWFYLLSEGGTGTNDLGNAYSVDGIGIEDAQKIAYRNLVTYLGEQATYADAFTGSLQAAADLFGNPSVEYTAVRNAWYAVGIGSDPNSYCSGTTNLLAISGEFEDGSGEANYNNNSNCSWLIAPPGATRITINFSAFATESTFDLVTIYDGPDDTYPVLKTSSGNSLPTAVSTTPGNGAMFVRFTSDADQTAAGWKASYTSQGIHPSCSGLTLLAAKTGSFDDGSGAGFYGNNQICTWYIAPSCATSITLSFLAFNTETNYDGVAVYDDFESTTPIATLTGTTIPTPVTSGTGKMKVVFFSDFSTAAGGFAASYTSTGTPQCDGVTTVNTSDHGTLSDGSNSSTYCNNLDCQWLIQPPQATSVKLTFTTFNVEEASSDGQSVYDAVEVYDGTTTSAPLLGRFTGTTIPPAVTSTSGSLLVRFFSDFATNLQGWTASYTSSQASACTGTATLTGESGTFSDGSGTGQYANNSNCSWLIKPFGAENVALTFSAFSTENNKDGVIVYDGDDNTAPVLGRFSGSTIPNFVVSKGNSLYVEFLTDASGRGEGWTADYTKATVTDIENFFDQKLRVFPNPSNGNFNIESSYSEEIPFTVTDLVGREVKSKSLLHFGVNEVDASALSTGIYFVRGQVGGRVVSRRVVIKK